MFIPRSVGYVTPTKHLPLNVAYLSSYTILLHLILSYRYLSGGGFVLVGSSMHIHWNAINVTKHSYNERNQWGGITNTPLNNFYEEVGIHNLIAIIVRIRETATSTQ